jgi:hypothetical protein
MFAHAGRRALWQGHGDTKETYLGLVLDHILLNRAVVALLAMRRGMDGLNGYELGKSRSMERLPE